MAIFELFSSRQKSYAAKFLMYIFMRICRRLYVFKLYILFKTLLGKTIMITKLELHTILYTKLYAKNMVFLLLKKMQEVMMRLYLITS